MSNRLDKELAKAAIGYGQLKADPNKLSGKPDHLSKYSVDQLTYPDNLFDPQKPLGPYVVFYINAFEGATVTKDESKLISKDDNTAIQKERMRGAAAKMAQNTEKFDRNILATSGVLGAGVAGGIGTLLSNTTPIPGGAIGVGASMVGVAVISNLNFNKAQRRLKSAIALHMPNDLSISYKAGYTPSNASAILGTMKVGESVAKAGGSIVNAALDINAETMGVSSSNAKTISDVGANLATSGKTLSSQLIGDTASARSFVSGAALNLLPGGDTLSVLSGVAANPKTQAVFSGVDPRTFTYSYNFYPKSQEELDKIREIINTLKANMLPEYKDADQFLFVYPSEFDIVYYMGSEENKYIHKHTSCVLMDLNIAYTPDGNFTFFNSSGAPTRLTVSMTFRELDIITKQEAELGY